MHPIEAFVRNPVKVAVGVLLVALFGTIALVRMPMQLTPEVQIPRITVQTRWPGASPQEIEREIIQEQEEQLKGVENSTKMTSESMDSIGRITIEFLVGTDMSEALLTVNSRLQQVPEYPEDADEPVISKSSSSDSPIAWFILSARMTERKKIEQFQATLRVKQPEVAQKLDSVLRAHNEGLAVLRLRLLAEEHPELSELLPPDIDVPKELKFTEDVIEARFERVRGVSNSNVFGGREPELQVRVNPQLMAAKQLTISDLRQALRRQNRDTSGGDLWEGKRRYVVRTLGQFDSPEQVADQLVAIRDGAPVYVRDVAEVGLGHKKPDSQVRRFGTASIAVNAQRDTGKNVLKVMKGLREACRELNESVLHRRGLHLTQVYDQTEYIYSAIHLVNRNIMVGGALTVIVLMCFLHMGRQTLLLAPLVALSAAGAVLVSPWLFLVTLALVLAAGLWFARGALVVSLAIPSSIIGSFLLLNLMERSLNVISLAGMAFAVGMLVDNAVVVLENVYRHCQRGQRPFAAAVDATREVWGAVIASTLTTIAVFLPVVFVQEEAGQLFLDIALAICSAVGLSLVVSVTVIPTAAARLFRRGESGQPSVASSSRRSSGLAENGQADETETRINRLGHAFADRVVDGIAWVQQGLLRRLVVVVGLVGVSLGLSYLLWPKVEYLPSGNRNLVFGIILPPPGYNLNKQIELGETVEADLRPYWDIDPESEEADQLDYPPIADFFYVARSRQVFMGLRAVDPTKAGQFVPLVDEIGGRFPGAFAKGSQASLFGRNLTAGRTIDVEITGPDLHHLVELGGQIMAAVPEIVKVQMPTPVGEDPVYKKARPFPIPSLDLSSPEVHVQRKPIQAREMGVDATSLGYTVDALVDGAYATDYFVGGDKIDLTIVGDQQYAARTQDLANLPIATPAGQLVPLGALADVKIDSGPEQINHRERQRAITIQVTPPAEIALEEAIELIRAEIIAPLAAGGQLQGGYTINLSGTADKLRDTWRALRWNVALALLITYLLMAALFESWLYPLVIIFSVPLGAVGGIAGLQLLNVYLRLIGQPPQMLDVLTMLGFVILIGTVVNNAILIVHQSLNHIRNDGMTPRESILESVRTRIRPIFMTTATTVCGLAPLVFFPGAGSELYRGLGAVVLGGLIVSTIFTLVLVPTLFSLVMDARGSGPSQRT